MIAKGRSELTLAVLIIAIIGYVSIRLIAKGRSELFVAMFFVGCMLGFYSLDREGPFGTGHDYYLYPAGERSFYSLDREGPFGTGRLPLWRASTHVSIRLIAKGRSEHRYDVSLELVQTFLFA